jgi:hypothetical protein
MRQVTASDFAEIHEIVRHFYSVGGIGWVFRGQADASWPVVPKAGRAEYYVKRDLGRFYVWRQRACAYTTLPANDWECLAIAQHHGLATRLLDWTTNPLIAAYFAIAALPMSDGAIYSYLPESYIDVNVASIDKISQVAAYMPRSVTARIVNQGGVFTYHPEPSTPLVGEPLKELSGRENLVQIRIPLEAKPDILRTLDKYGFNEVGLFPDLDGLSRHVNWETGEMVKRRKRRES